MPIVRVSQKIRTMAPGDELVVDADDPAFKADIEAWAQMTGHKVVSLVEGEVTTAVLRRHG